MTRYFSLFMQNKLELGAGSREQFKLEADFDAIIY